MKTYKIDGKDIEIAETAKDIKMDKFVKFILDGKDVKNNTIEFKELLIVLLTTLTYDEIENLPYSELRDLMASMDDTPLDFETDFMSEITIDGVSYKANLKDGKYNLKVKDTKIIESLIGKYNVDYIYYLPGLIFRTDWSTPVTLEEVVSNKDIFKDITADVVGPYVIHISKMVNEKGI